MKTTQALGLLLGLALAVASAVTAQTGSTVITGKVTDPEGKPVPDARVSLFPSFSSVEKRADSEGRFTLPFDPNQMGPMGEMQPIVVARDADRNLAAAVELEEGATNADVRLGTALTLVGRITDPEGRALTNARVTTVFHTERMGSNLGSPARPDSEGHFEIKGLPQGRQYSIVASAKGFRQERRSLPVTDTATNRIEFETFQLVRANQRIAGVVLDADDNPVARAYVYTYGEMQPNLNAQTDAKGRFSLDKVCPGPVELSANTRSGEYGNTRAEGGDTNITIRVSVNRSVRLSQVSAPRLKGKPLPDLASLGFGPADVPADQPLLALLIDAEQRPSRRALRALGEQSAALKEKGLTVVVIQAGGMTEDAFKAWKQEAALPFPVGCLVGSAEKARTAWGAGAFPWLILTDKSHRVSAEGFAIEELETKLKEDAK